MWISLQKDSSFVGDYLDIEKLIRILEETDEIELENVDIFAEELELFMSPLEKAMKPAEYRDLEFELPLEEFRGEIPVVKFGHTKSEGGTRSHSLYVGGEKTMPFYRFEFENPYKPVVAFDVFDMKIGLAKPVKIHYDEVLEDPAAWASLCVDKFGADMVTIHLISTDPLLKDTPIHEALKTVEDVLQAVKVPIIIGGSGNPNKDPELLEKAAEVAEGERVMLNSASMNLDYKKVAQAAMDHDHVVLSWTQLDINDQKTLNRHLFEMGAQRENMLIDPTTAALGYGLEYSFSMMERMRLAALKGDSDLQCPIASGTTNAWGAREAWMKESPIEGETWGDRMKRGPLWEAVSAFTLCLAGCDLFMMMCPTSVQLFREMINQLGEDREMNPAADWLSGGA
ncbi:MAG: CO dehydrogenase/acetyl-CoA synthase subunit delta [Theionarchaea archaeon]|nr:CO dehydrogenase/acetyl-CoA synthase subunit delta [Theionarchaea archaeon]